MKQNIFIDDFRHPYDAYLYTHNSKYLKLEWTIVRNYDEFIQEIKIIGLDNINIISMDHDLADQHYERHPWATDNEIDYFSYTEKTGYDCAKWMCNHAFDKNEKIPNILIHTMNGVGGDNIKHYIKNFIKHNPKLSC